MATSVPATYQTVADLLADLGGIDPGRVRITPPPGTATEDDMIRANDERRGRFELVDATLVEKRLTRPREDRPDRSRTDPDRTLDDLLADLGDVDPGRILLHPPLGTATVDDLERINGERRSIYELVDGVLVEKGMGLWESILTLTLARYLMDYVATRSLGLVSGADGQYRLEADISRAPDLAFFSWDRVHAAGGMSREALRSITPDLAIEVLSPSNRPGEMSRKRRDYFSAGVRLVWEVDPDARRVTVYEADRATVVDSDGTLDGGAVLPGFALSVARIFADVDRGQRRGGDEV